MSILETFYILFKTDADDAAKDIKKVDDASDKAAAGLNKMDAAATGVGASFKRMAAAIVGPLLTLATAGAALNIAVARAAAVRELDQFSSKLNSSVADVDAFQRSVKGMGGETAAALDSLVKLGEKVNEAFSDAESGARKDFTEWGLAFKDAEGGALGASDAMLELAGNLENVSRAEALARIKKLGIEDAASIDLLLKGRAALEQRIRAEKELGVVTEEQAAGVREYYGELGRAQNALTSIGNAILSALLPAMTKAVEVFGNAAEWVGRNGTLVQGFFIGLAGIITAVYLPAMLSAAAATIAATWPLLAIAAAIAAVAAGFALAYEDVVAFLNGDPSLIGALAEKYEGFRRVIEFIGDAFKVMREVGSEAINALGKSWDVYMAGLRILAQATIDFKNTATETYASIVEAVNATAQAIKDGFSAAFNFVKSVWDNTIGALADQISGIAERVRGLLETLGLAGGTINVTGSPANDNVVAAGRSIGAMMGQGQALAAGASGAAINTATPGAISAVNTSNVTVGNVTVNTQATDARAVAGAVRGELQKQLRGTAAQFDDGVDR